MINVNLKGKTRPEILDELVTKFREEACCAGMTEEQLTDFVMRTHPWLECRAMDGAMVMPMRCMFCPTGHMTECHYPHACNDPESNCQHYQQEEEY